MKFIRRIFFLKTIYGARTMAGLSLMVLYVATSIIFMTGSFYLYDGLPSYRWMGLAVRILWWVFAWMACRELARLWILRKILKLFPPALAGAIPGSNIAVSAADAELDSLDTIRIVHRGNGWHLSYAVFNHYRKTKNGTYLAKQSCYTVVEIKLNRFMPHVIFDSHAAKKRQFKAVYSQTQKISMDVDFDDVFDTYVPHTYQVDTLSFISPEVLQALKAARHYDFELLGDKLLCYGPLLLPGEATDITQKAIAVGSEINNNLRHYKDDRLTGSEAWTNVTPLARQLLRNPFREIAYAVASGLMVAVMVYLAVWHPQPNGQVYYNGFTAYVCIFFLYSLYRYKRSVDANRRIKWEMQKTTSPRRVGSEVTAHV